MFFLFSSISGTLILCNLIRASGEAIWINKFLLRSMTMSSHSSLSSIASSTFQSCSSLNCSVAWNTTDAGVSFWYPTNESFSVNLEQGSVSLWSSYHARIHNYHKNVTSTIIIFFPSYTYLPTLLNRCTHSIRVSNTLSCQDRSTVRVSTKCFSKLWLMRGWSGNVGGDIWRVVWTWSWNASKNLLEQMYPLLMPLLGYKVLMLRPPVWHSLRIEAGFHLDQNFYTDQCHHCSIKDFLCHHLQCCTMKWRLLNQVVSIRRRYSFAGGMWGLQMLLVYSEDFRLTLIISLVDLLLHVSLHLSQFDTQPGDRAAHWVGTMVHMLPQQIDEKENYYCRTSMTKDWIFWVSIRTVEEEQVMWTMEESPSG